MRWLIAVTSVVALACADERQKAVEETLKFAQTAPYALGNPTSKYSGFKIAVADSGLSSYNHVFQYFEPKDTTRATLYRDLPGLLLGRLPITKIESISTSVLSGDTVKVIATYERVDSKLLEQLAADFYSSADTLPPTDDQQKRFKVSLARVRQQLREKDTAYFWVAKGPNIVRFRSASQMRDSVAVEKENAKTLVEFNRIFAQASFSRLTARIYPIAYGLQGGGTMQAHVDPGPGGWYKAPGFASMEVQCEARNGGRSTRNKSYILSDIGAHERNKALCLWSGDEVSEWNEIQPKSFRMRLVGMVEKDSVFGPWVEFPANSITR